MSTSLLIGILGGLACGLTVSLILLTRKLRSERKRSVSRNLETLGAAQKALEGFIKDGYARSPRYWPALQADHHAAMIAIYIAPGEQESKTQRIKQLAQEYLDDCKRSIEILVQAEQIVNQSLPRY